MSASAGRTRGDPAAGPYGSGSALVAVLVTSSFVVVLDYAGVVILLPPILADLGGGLDGITWVLAAFVLAFAVLLLPCGRLAGHVGSKRLLIAGTAVFTLGAGAAALAPSIGLLVGMRVVQGAGAAASEAAVFAIIRSIVPPERQSRTLTAQSGAFFLGAALGPVLPGAIATGLSWQFFFWLEALLGVVVVAAALRYLPSPERAPKPRSRDPLGAVVGGAALSLLFFAVVEGDRLRWDSPAIMGTSAAAVIGFAAFCVVERRVVDPLVRPSLFGHRRYAVGITVRAATEFTSLGIFLPLSHFLQVQLGYSALAAGLVLTSIIGGALLSAPAAEPLAERLDVRWLVVPGFVLVAAGTFWLAHVSQQTGWAFFVAPLILTGVGMGALEGPAEKAAQRDVPAADADAAAQVSYTVYLLGVGLGVTVVSAVWQSRGSQGAADAVDGALLACVLVSVLGAIAGAFLTTSGRSRRPARDPD